MIENDIKDLELDAIIKGSNENIVITDGEGIILKASPNSFVIYGKEDSELINESVFDLERQGILTPSATVRVLNERKQLQLMQFTQSSRIIMVKGIPVFDNNGDIFRVITLSFDLTDYENLKEEYELLKMQLEHYQTEIQELRDKELVIDNIVMRSLDTQNIWKLIQKVSKTDASVIFYGESGVGKTVFARALHNGSYRHNGPFIEVNCGAIPESLFESEMFGYESGAFTGANRNGKPGVIELANKGTLFLDEIGELPLSVQAKLLKVIQEKVIIRVGGIKSKAIDFRLVASTNRDLYDMVKKGHFREDLYYRLNVVSITIPALRDRKEDVIVLSKYFLKKFNEKYKTDKYLHSTTLEWMVSLEWKGNVRELENMIERLIVTSETRVIYPESYNFKINEKVMNDENDLIFEENIDLKKIVEDTEIYWLEKAMEKYKTTYEIAQYLGINQSNIVRKLKKYGINAKRY
ncbi:sigma-54 interaction domain-containing protein [Peribacillus butanolivorans]|uniref:sigma-54 interaction domain-containing protein n=1 Tax=Peribacillus butanolivorans TaxID=421767 RepID=UPI0035D92525